MNRWTGCTDMFCRKSSRPHGDVVNPFFLKIFLMILA
jgi:hypothetical protein